MWRRRSRCPSKATMWWWIFDQRSKQRQAYRTRKLSFLTCIRELSPFPGIAHQRGITIDAVHELAVRHGDKQRKYHAKMQRQQRSRGRAIAPKQKRHSGEAGQ